MSAVLEEIIEEVRALPPDEQGQLREVLNNNELLGWLFMAAAFGIISKVKALDPAERQQLLDVLNHERNRIVHGSLSPEQRRRADIIRSIRGKYAHLPTSSDDFAARKAEEIALEDRRSLS